MQNRFNILGLTLVILLASCSSSEDEQIQEELSSSGSTEIGLIDDERILAAANILSSSINPISVEPEELNSS